MDVLTLQIKDRLAQTIHPDDVLTRVGDAEVRGRLARTNEVRSRLKKQRNA